ncbi:MAG: 5-carboxymethyl-2-hydroxymuconate Delta-isomerase [Alphaproteobacteria bacterium]|nr:5-carboxymethyl-2-hydroxymuconate Delta-isomerase [Alphaproteobacteria bacterium]
MPHFVIEYSKDLEPDVAPETLMTAAHEVGIASQLFEGPDIKVRLIPVGYSLVAGKRASSLHITIYLLSGRNQATKKALTQAFVEAFEPLVPTCESVSANAIDMDRQTYSKIIR